jgi:hypothetical protein
MEGLQGGLFCRVPAGERFYSSKDRWDLEDIVLAVH